MGRTEDLRQGIGPTHQRCWFNRERLPAPDLRATGIDFSPAFDRWVGELGATLAHVGQGSE